MLQEHKSYKYDYELHMVIRGACKLYKQAKIKSFSIYTIF